MFYPNPVTKWQTVDVQIRIAGFGRLQHLVPTAALVTLGSIETSAAPRSIIQTRAESGHSLHIRKTYFLPRTADIRGCVVGQLVVNHQYVVGCKCPQCGLLTQHRDHGLRDRSGPYSRARCRNQSGG